MPKVLRIVSVIGTVLAVVGLAVVAVVAVRHNRSDRVSVAGSATPTASIQTAAATSAVETAFAQAMTIHQSIIVRPGITETASGAVAGKSMTTAPAVVAPDDATRARQADLANRQVKGIFEAGPAAKEMTALANAISAERDLNFRELGSGISKIAYDAVEVTRTTASVVGHVTVWGKCNRRTPMERG